MLASLKCFFAEKRAFSSTSTQILKSFCVQGIIFKVTRMPDERLPKKVLYGELQEGKHSQGGQKKR